MPAIDACEQSMANALTKDGWRITDRPTSIALPDGHYLYVDLKAQRVTPSENLDIILVEVKCFSEKLSQLEELYRALGQYLVYYHVLTGYNQQDLLYLAMPIESYHAFLERKLFPIRPGIPIRIIVCDIDREEIEEWINWSIP
jgi:hypothetical protein